MAREKAGDKYRRLERETTERADRAAAAGASPDVVRYIRNSADHYRREALASDNRARRIALGRRHGS